jgi:hypothetical protein
VIKIILKLVAPVLVIGALMSSSATAAPLLGSMALKNVPDSLVDQVHWRGRGWGGRGWGGRGYGWGGFAAGAIIGSALASPYYYRPYAPYGYGGYGYGYGYYPRPYYPSYAGYPPPVSYYGGGYGGGSVEYCMQRFRSYDPRSGTYVGYDGRRRPCP